MPDRWRTTDHEFSRKVGYGRSPDGFPLSDVVDGCTSFPYGLRAVKGEFGDQG